MKDGSESELTPGEIQAVGAMKQAFGDLSEAEIRDAVLELRRTRGPIPEPPSAPEAPSLKAKVQGRARYRYRAKDARGKSTEGFLEAVNENEARRLLLNRFPALLEVSETPTVSTPRARVRVKPDTVVIFYRRLASMLAAGVTVHRALEFLAQSEDDRRLRGVIEELVQAITSGRTFSGALGISGVFDRVSMGLVVLGEETGGLVEAVGKLADLTEADMRQRRALQAALTYPIALFFSILAMALLFVVVLGPGDSGLFSLFEGELPWPTQVMVGLSQVLHTPWLLLALGGGLALLVFWLYHLYRYNEAVRLAVHSWVLKQPLLGNLVCKTVSARMLYVMAAAVQVGVPVPQALDMAREVCSNDAIRRRFAQAIEAFRAGADLSEALAAERVFPPLVTSLIHLGLETGKLDSAMAGVSRTYEEDVEMALTNLTRLAEPILLAFGGALTAFITLATLLPILQVVNHFA